MNKEGKPAHHNLAAMSLECRLMFLFLFGRAAAPLLGDYGGITMLVLHAGNRLFDIMKGKKEPGNNT